MQSKDLKIHAKKSSDLYFKTEGILSNSSVFIYIEKMFDAYA